jgi:cyanophycinase
MDGGSIDSAAALKNPGGPAVTIVHDFLHLPHLKHVVTDTHFNARNRLGRLVAFVAQVRATTDPSAVGLGVDQGSALCVEASGIGHLHSLSKGFAWLVQPRGIAKIEPNHPLNYAAVRITGVGADGAIDLNSLRIRHPAFTGTAMVKAGRLVGAPGPASPVPPSYSDPN